MSKEQLVKLLANVDRPGTFCTEGTMPFTMPGLDVPSFGPIAFPLHPSQAQELIQHCQQAPYGKGTATLVDANVRRVWHIPAAQLTIHNPSWAKYVAQIVEQVQANLGLEQQRLDAHLYDLLLYETGSFFLPHQDGEKLDRMVGTLVLTFPSEFTGGELVVRHAGQEQTIAFRRPEHNPFDIHFAAFYADCEHEVRPLTSGYRLALVYNLTLAKGKTVPKAPNYDALATQLATALQAYLHASEEPKLGITLAHEYTEKGLAWDALKGTDRATADVVRRAAELAKLNVYMGLLTYHEAGGAEDTEGDYYRRRSYRRHDDEDEDEDESNDGSRYIMGEIYEQSLTVGELQGPNGETYPSLAIDNEELLDPALLTLGEPEEQFEGYTGNAGMTLDRWYRYAVLILWSPERHFEVLCGYGGAAALPEFFKLYHAYQEQPTDEQKQACMRFATIIVQRWQYSGGDSSAKKFVEALDRLGAGALAGELLIRATPFHDFDPGPQASVIMDRQGWATFRPLYDAMFAPTERFTDDYYFRHLDYLFYAEPTNRTAWHTLCVSVLEQLVAKLLPDATNYWGLGDDAGIRRLVTVTPYFFVLGETARLNNWAQRVQQSAKFYPLKTVQLPALGQLLKLPEALADAHRPIMKQWLDHCRQGVQADVKPLPTPFPDQRRPQQLACRCKHCTTINEFLKHPTQETIQFATTIAERDHCDRSIRTAQADVAWKADKSKRPHTIVVTKTNASYDAALAHYKQTNVFMATLDKLEEKFQRPTTSVVQGPKRKPRKKKE